MTLNADNGRSNPADSNSENTIFLFCFGLEGMVVELVLATDLKQHFAILASAKEAFSCEFYFVSVAVFVTVVRATLSNTR